MTNWQFGIIQNFQTSPTPQTSFLIGTFLIFFEIIFHRNATILSNYVNSMYFSNIVCMCIKLVSESERLREQITNLAKIKVRTPNPKSIRGLFEIKDLFWADTFMV